MISRSQVLNVLKTYGFYSLNRAPYIYYENNRLGVYFVWPHKYFGSLERVIFFDDVETLEKVVFEYWWFKEYGNKYEIEVVFDDYETVSPKVSYKYQGKVINWEIMKNFKENFFDNTDGHFNNLVRSAKILILILKEKMVRQLKDFEKLTKLDNRIAVLNKCLEDKIKGEEGSSLNNSDGNLTNFDECEQICNGLNEELISYNTSNDVINFIDNLITYMEMIDSKESTLQNNYLIIKYQYQVNDLEEKISIINNLKDKKKIIKNKKIIEELLDKIDAKSNSKTMIKIDAYIKNEQKRIKENYDDLKNISKEVVGDYLLNFEKLSLDVDIPIEENVKEGKKLDKKDVKKRLQEFYEKLNDKEKCACNVVNSFLKKLVLELYQINNWENLKIDDLEVILKENNLYDMFWDNYKIIADFNNINVRVKYMKYLKIDTFGDFLNSLKEMVKIFKKINFKLNEDFYAYYLNDGDFIELYLKNIWHKSRKTLNIGNILANTNLYYAPVMVKRVLDVIESNELVAQEKDYIFIWQDNVKISDEKEEVVAVYEKDNIIKEQNYFEVRNIKLVNKCNYEFKTISNK